MAAPLGFGTAQAPLPKAVMTGADVSRILETSSKGIEVIRGRTHRPEAVRLAMPRGDNLGRAEEDGSSELAIRGPR
jgi:hypothetical protein